MTIHDFIRENKSLHQQLNVKELEADRYKNLWVQSMAKFNYLNAQHVIAKDALNNIAERNFIPPSMAADVAVDALYKIGTMGEEDKNG